MPFPLDPNAPGGPGRSEYLRAGFAAAGAPPADQSPDLSIRLADNVPALGEPAVLAEVDGEPVAALGLSAGDVVADPERVNVNIMALLHLRRLEARLIMSVFGA